MNMKKRVFITLLMTVVFSALSLAQHVQEGEMAVVYHMPLTQLAITIEYDEIVMTPGPFYLYAERYLGAKEVITESNKRYEMSHISSRPNTIADPNRTYKVVAQDGAELQLLSLTNQGLLYGYNVPACAAESAPELSIQLPKECATDLMPLLEEQMVASSTAKMAEGTAKMIYNIRETRLNILAGDVDHTPADGVAMQLVLDELNKREKMLTELFVGSCQIHHHTQTIYYTPSNDVNQHVLARMSKFSGIVAADDLSGEPIRISVKGQRQAFETTDEVLLLDAAKPSKSKSSKTLVPSQIYYNMPGSAQITLEYGKHVFSEMTLPIAQYGVAVPLAKNLLNTKQLPQIYFNTTTGNILSIQK